MMLRIPEHLLIRISVKILDQVARTVHASCRYVGPSSVALALVCRRWGMFSEDRRDLGHDQVLHGPIVVVACGSSMLADL